MSSSSVQRVYPDGRITTIEGNYANHVALVGPFQPAHATGGRETAPIYGYAQPPSAATERTGKRGG